MTKIAFLLTVLVTALVCGLPAAPAQAQATRAFVSAAGSDTNNCINVLTPCRHFQTAYNAMSNGGEIDVLDPANYGSLIVNHTLSVVGRGWATLSPVAGAAAITINSGASDTINISGVALDGAGLANTAGVQFNSGGSLSIQECVIRNSTTGIKFVPSASTSNEISVSNTVISDNSNIGISVAPTGSGAVTGVLDQVQITNTTAGSGVIAQASGQTVTIMVRNSTIANNNAVGLVAELTGATIRVTRSTITGNSTGVLGGTGGVVLSYADNNIDGNTVDNTGPSTIPYK
jgi:Right handed beta helix region